MKIIVFRVFLVSKRKKNCHKQHSIFLQRDCSSNQKDAERNSLQYDVLNKPPSFIWTPFVKKTYFGKSRQICGKVGKVGDGDDGDGGGGRIFPGHPGPIPNVPRDQISRKGIPSLRPWTPPEDPKLPNTKTPNPKSA